MEKDSNNKKRKSSTGLDENIAAFLCYAFIWASGILFVLIEKESRLVRFHAMQSILTFGGLSIVIILLKVFVRAMPFFLIEMIDLISMIVWIIIVLLWIYLMISAYKGRITKIPVLGDIAANTLER